MFKSREKNKEHITIPLCFEPPTLSVVKSRRAGGEKEKKSSHTRPRERTLSFVCVQCVLCVRGVRRVECTLDKAQTLAETARYLSMRSALTKGYPTDCLLYTSPSPRDGLLSRMPSSA